MFEIEFGGIYMQFEKWEETNRMNERKGTNNATFCCMCNDARPGISDRGSRQGFIVKAPPATTTEGSINTPTRIYHQLVKAREGEDDKKADHTATKKVNSSRASSNLLLVAVADHVERAGEEGPDVPEDGHTQFHDRGSIFRGPSKG